MKKLRRTLMQAIKFYILSALGLEFLMVVGRKPRRKKRKFNLLTVLFLIFVYMFLMK